MELVGDHSLPVRRQLFRRVLLFSEDRSGYAGAFGYVAEDLVPFVPPLSDGAGSVAAYAVEDESQFRLMRGELGSVTFIQFFVVVL